MSPAKKNLKNRFQISKYFDLDDYDSLMTSDVHYKNLIRTLLKIINSSYERNDKIRILEIGAGTGLFTRELLSNFKEAEIVVIEPDKKCCEKLYSCFGKEIRIIQAEGEGFREGKYDIAVMCESFHHIAYENKEAVVKNISELLTDSGIFIVADFFIPKFNNEEERKESLKRCFLCWIKELQKRGDEKHEKMARKTLGLAMQKAGGYHLSPERFEDIMKNAGFKLLKKLNVSKTSAEKEGATLILKFLKTA